MVGTGQNEEYRAAISGKLKEYLSAFYEDGSSPTSVANGVGSVYVSPQGQIAIVISFKNLNQNNYWTGGWQSEWTLSVNKKGSTKLEGRIRINVHYFEDGNVQLNSTFNEQGEVDVSVKYKIYILCDFAVCNNHLNMVYIGLCIDRRGCDQYHTNIRD